MDRYSVTFMKKILGFSVVFLIVAAYYFFPESKLQENISIDRIVVRKSERRMDVYSDGVLIKTYSISLGRNPVGDKEKKGDKRTPEGKYFIESKNAQSGYHKNLGVSFPNADDRREAKRKGLDPAEKSKSMGFEMELDLSVNFTGGMIGRQVALR
jgi:murein L,D-transpeptidase YafK